MSTEFFSPDYVVAAERFRAACASLGFETARYVNRVGQGARGEELAIDVSRVGPASAERILVLTIGVHGLEGFCGSAVVLQWLKRGMPRLAPGQALVIVHAVNPWGFSYLSRTNENNVDLNRNFKDFAGEPLRPNPIYAALHPALCPPHWTPQTIAAGRAALEEANRTHGVPAVTDAMARGQYEIADGLFYGGSAPEWSNRTVREIFARHVPSGRSVTAIDLHTGLGPYGEPLLLCFHPRESEAFKRVAVAYGEGVRDAGRTYTGGQLPDFSGLMIDAMEKMLSHRSYHGLVIEFGTRQNSPHDQVKDALRLDRWLRFGKPDPAADRESLKALVLENYCPSSEEWRRSVLRSGNDLLDRAMTI